MTRAKPSAKRVVRRFPKSVISAIDKSHYVRIRAGTEHRFIAIWGVVVGGRVFVRSWYMKPAGWFHTFAQTPLGAIRLEEREIPVRASRVRSARLKDAVDKAYAAKYVTPASIKYVKGFARGKRKDTTTELTPR